MQPGFLAVTNRVGWARSRQGPSPEATSYGGGHFLWLSAAGNTAARVPSFGSRLPVLKPPRALSVNVRRAKPTPC